MPNANACLAGIGAVYRSRGGDFFRLALARTGDPERAGDAVQEGFARAIRGRHSYQGTGSLEAWVARCVINAATDAARSPTLAGVGLEELVFSREFDGGSPSAPPVLTGDAEIVRRAVRELPRRQRDALFLRFYLGFDYAAIAETLGIAVGTVSATLHAARASLAEGLTEVAT
jgi:RNA polymerase sigma factor (sigma-70 family)